MRALNSLGYVYTDTGRLDEARACFEEAHTIAQIDHNEEAQMLALANLGTVTLGYRRFRERQALPGAGAGDCPT